MISVPDSKIYMTRAELAQASGRRTEDITDQEYEKYLEWTSQRW